MKTYIASNDLFLTTNLRAALQQSGIECPSSQVLTHDPASLLSSRTIEDGATIFFASEHYTADELVLLKQLCATFPSSKVVAVGSNLRTENVLSTIRAGALDCLDVNGKFDTELRGVMQRVLASSASSRPAGRLITVVGTAGGVGSSLLATNLAVILAQRNFQACLLDLHVRGGDIAALLKCDPRHTLASLAAQDEQLDHAMFEQSLIEHKSGVRLLASPPPLSDFHAIEPSLILKVVQLARSAFSHVVVDLEDIEHDEQIRVLASSDCVILVLRPDFTSLYRSSRYLQFLTEAKVPREHVKVVLNFAGMPKAISSARMSEALKVEIEHCLPHDSVTANSSINLGMPLALTFPKSELAQQIFRLADALVGKVPTNGHSHSWIQQRVDRLKSILPVTK